MRGVISFRIEPRIPLSVWHCPSQADSPFSPHGTQVCRPARTMRHSIGPVVLALLISEDDCATSADRRSSGPAVERWRCALVGQELCGTRVSLRLAFAPESFRQPNFNSSDSVLFVSETQTDRTTEFVTVLFAAARQLFRVARLQPGQLFGSTSVTDRLTSN